MGGMTFFFLLSLSFYVLIILAIYKAYKNRRALHFLIGLFIAIALGFSLKYGLQIPRPSYENLGLSKWDKYGFPSMHSLLSFYAGAYLGSVGLIWASLIAISRVMLNVHSILDVLVGGVLGLFIYYAFKDSHPNNIDKKEVVRQILHFLVASSLLFTAYFFESIKFFVFVGFILMLYLFALITYPRKIYDYVKRKDKDFGALYLIAGIALSYLIFGKNIAVIVAIVMAIGDSLTPIFAMILNQGKKRCWKASILASLFVFATLAYFYDSFSAFFASMAFGLVDYFNKWVDDNILIPLIVGVVMVIVI